jgi:hypothetical protein
MSVENNQSRTIDGLNTLFCDVINIVESIEINGDNGDPNQIILSNGTRIDWGNISDLIQNLSVSPPLQFTTGTNYNGSIIRTIEIPNLSIENAKLISSTISGVSLGGVLSQLTLSSPLSFTTGSNYTGEAVRQITIANGAISNLKLENSTISGVSLGDDLPTLYFGNGLYAIDGDASPAVSYNGTEFIGLSLKLDGSTLSLGVDGIRLTADTISGIQLGNNLPLLTANAPLSFVVGAEYNGQNARTLQISNIGNSDLQNSTISGVSLGSDLEDLTAGDGLELNSGTTYNGGSAKTISLSPPYKTISDRVSYEDTGVGVERWLYTINAGDWRPNDDSTTYNIHIEDDSVPLMGRAKAGISSLEAVAILQIPYDWTPAKIFIDCRDSAGNNLSRTYYLYKIYNWGGTGSTYLGSFTTNSETSIATSYGTGSSQYSLLVKMILTATTDHLGGGYITLTAPS